MDRGYIKLWRKTLDTEILKNKNLWAFWGYCLLRAAYKQHTVTLRFQEITLYPGQFIFGRKAAAKDLEMSEQEIRTCVQSLSNSKNLTIKSTNKFSIISIVNWNTYQQTENEINQQINHQVTSNQPASNQQVTTYKKERKKEGNNTYSEEFEKFWKAYPNKIGKGAALESWNKNGRPSLEIILQAIMSQIIWRKSAKPGEFRPEWKHPKTWLNQKCWEDEVKVEESGPFG